MKAVNSRGSEGKRSSPNDIYSSTLRERSKMKSRLTGVGILGCGSPAEGNNRREGRKARCDFLLQSLAEEDAGGGMNRREKVGRSWDCREEEKQLTGKNGSGTAGKRAVAGSRCCRSPEVAVLRRRRINRRSTGAGRGWNGLERR